MEDINKPKKFDANVYISNYTKEHYDRITITAPKGKKSDVTKKAKADGLSASQYILGAIQFYEDHREDRDSES